MPTKQPIRVFFLSALLIGTAALAEPRVEFAVPPGPLAAALALAARQAGIDIGGLDPALARIGSPGVHGRLATPDALRRLLAGTPFDIAMVAPGTFRLVRRPIVPTPAPAPERSAARRHRPPPPGTPAAVASGDIVVRGGKRDVPLATYPGSAQVILLGQDDFGPHGSGGNDYILRKSPILQSTQLGSGRDKLFIRGIADSSFNGPTQSTAGTYFGDVRVGYSGPDPNLNLYDVDRVEVLEGPQGALYGAGSLGGVIRLSPRVPALDRTEGSADVGVSATAHGGAGYDAAAMLNLAPVKDSVGLRIVAYRNSAGGYIDDPARRLSNINRFTQSGGRVALRLRPLDGWTIDAGGVIQESHQPDLQYALIENGPLERRSVIAQPFEDDYKLGRLVITKDWDSGLRLVSATGHVEHDFDQRYDATRPPRFAQPTAYDEHNRIRLTTQEVRLSRDLPGGDGWLVGASYVNDDTAKTREFGLLASQRELIGVTNRTEEKAVFGTATRHLGAALSITAGLRYTNARMDGEPSSTPVAGSRFIRGQSSSRVDPSLGLSYRLDRRFALFAQYQQGFRTGGLAVAPGVGRVGNFRNDRIYVGEGGVRLVRSGATGLAAVAAVSFARWQDIQADLISAAGFPYTANVGNGRVLAFEGSVDWVPLPALQISGGLFLVHSRLDDPAPDFASSGSRPLPDTPPITATAAAAWQHPLRFASLRLEANARYVGRSRLGVGPVLDLPYGIYLQTGAAATLAFTRLALTLSVDNAFDERGNRFAIGNPFGVAFRDEVTPLRPRTIRLGAKTSF